MADEFEAIEPAAREVTVGGQVFRVAPITIERLPAFARALRPLMPTVSELAGIDEGADPSYVADLLLELVEHNGELLVDAVAAGVASTRADIPATRERVAKLDPADFVLLALPVVKVNADFFARRLLPLLAKVRAEARTLATPGATPTASKP